MSDEGFVTCLRGGEEERCEFVGGGDIWVKDFVDSRDG